jgi:hypothetical protein
MKTANVADGENGWDEGIVKVYACFGGGGVGYKAVVEG